MNPRALHNRLLIATAMWRDETEDPLPRLEPDQPERQIETFELALVDLLMEEATAESARRQADKMWQLVHDRPDEDAVKRRVTEHHEKLAKLGLQGGSA